MTRTDSQLREWYAACFAELISQPEVRRAAQLELARLAAGGTITPHTADLEAARPYLKKCVENMSAMELENISAESAGALWPRGALGAARYRERQGKNRHRKRRTARLRESGRVHDDD